jgi:hypothetical protein
MKDRDVEKLTLEALRLEGKPMHRGGITFQRALLPLLRKDPERLPGHYYGEPQRMFLPRGLAVWGAPAGAMVAASTIGMQLQIVCSYGPVPVRFFSLGDSYEQIAIKLDAGAEPPAWCDWDPITPGHAARFEFVDLEGKPLLTPLELAFWGIAAI